MSFVTCSDKMDEIIPGVVIPEVSVNDITTERSKNQESIRFSVSLDKPGSNNVSFDYKLVEGTAKFDVDFIPGTGSVTIPAQQLSTSIEVFIVGNELRQPNLEFTIQLMNPKGCTLKKSTATCTIVNENGIVFNTPQNGFSTPVTYPGKNQVWAEEFDGPNLNLNHWNQEIGNGSSKW